VLTVEDWAEIRRLRRAERMPISQIARVLGILRNTVRAALASDSPPKYQRRPAGSITDAVEPRIRELLRAYPTMPATASPSGSGGTARSGCCAAGSPSCARRICHRTGRAHQL
jgi:transposase